MQIIIYMKDMPAMSVSVNNTETGRSYYYSTKTQYNKSFPYYKDNKIWTVQKLYELAKQVKSKMEWDWAKDDYSEHTLAMLHKDLEKTVGTFGFDDVSAEDKDLLYEIHHCLHAITHNKINESRSCNFQIEWLEDIDTLPLPSSFEFCEYVSRGDLILINPYVGHNPLQVYMENDTIDFSSTVKFHDIIRPAVVLSSFNHNITKDEIVQWFKKHDTQFVNKVGEEKVRYYSGSAILGKVDDIEIFNKIMSYTGEHKLEKIEFYD